MYIFYKNSLEFYISYICLMFWPSSNKITWLDKIEQEVALRAEQS